MTTLSDDQIKYARYKWEFLRRNPEYIKDWEKLQKDLEQIYSEFEELQYGPMGQSKIEIEFFKKWRVGNPLCPHNSYDDIIPTKEKIIMDKLSELAGPEDLLKRFDWERTVFGWLHPTFSEVRSGVEGTIDLYKQRGYKIENWDELREKLNTVLFKTPLTVLDGWQHEADYEPDLGDVVFLRGISKRLIETGLLKIEIDLNYSKNRLMEEFKNLIDEWKERYESEQNSSVLKERKEKYEKKYHFDNYDLYLQVYDLKQEGKSWSQITTELELNSVQTARNHYNPACELIEKGIDLYVK